MKLSTWLSGLVFAALPLVGGSIQAADTRCGNGTCSESICSSTAVIECSDWNDRNNDGWAVSGNSPLLGSILAGKGYNGSAGWESKINIGSDATVWFDKGISSTSGPLHERHMVMFSPGYQFMMVCGLQKQFYFNRSGGRVMVGVTKASDMGGAYAGQPNTVGIFGFDYYGHYVELPKQAGDQPTLIQTGRWYSLETMVDPSTKTVKMWVDGKLQMTRSGDSRFGDGSAVTSVQDTSWFGGDPNVCSKNTQVQYVYHDNHVISRSYIGPPGGSSTPEPAPTAPPAPVLLP